MVYFYFFKDVIIKCKKKKLNHERNQKYEEFKEIPLASKGWKNKKSKDDYFTIDIYSDVIYHILMLIVLGCIVINYFFFILGLLTSEQKTVKLV